MKDYSNYHGTNTNEKISHDGLLILEKSLNGFEGYDVVINSTVNSKVLIYQKWDADSETKKVIGRIEDIDRGNLLRINNMDWLVTTLPEDNKIYRKAEMKLCNSTFPIQSNKTRDLLGYNPITNEPIYSEYKEVLVEIPCIVESKYSSTNNDGDTLTIPENELIITMKHYEDAEHVRENFEFEMYNQPYKITNIDSTKVVAGKGIVKIIARRDV